MSHRRLSSGCHGWLVHPWPIHCWPSQQWHPHRRRGTTLMEVVVALALLGLATTAMIEFVSLSARQRRTAEHRRVALQELANQAERVAFMSWDELAPDRFTTWQPSTDLSSIPSATCRAEVADESGPLACRRIRLLVQWKDALGQELDP